MSFLTDDYRSVFTGDALLIRGCGRTDFQQGSAERLFESIHGKIFSLPAEVVVYPGHDYRGRLLTTIEEEKAFNARLAGKSKEEFIEIMNSLKLGACVGVWRVGGVASQRQRGVLKYPEQRERIWEG
jgi:sulfur dioxygenase